MSTASNWGHDLNPQDYADLAARWIPREIADYNGIRRVSDKDARFMFHRRENSEGLIIPNYHPWEADHIRQYRLRPDHPPLELRRDGSSKPKFKYLSEPGAPNVLYIPRGAMDQTGPNVPVIVTEGELKALALWRLANHETDKPRFLPIALAGVWNWKGTVGKEDNARGRRVDVRGVIPDIERFRWKDRRVVIAFDADVALNSKIKAARKWLTDELVKKGATVGWLEWELAEGKGIDDRLAKIGPDPVLAQIASVQYDDWKTRLIHDGMGGYSPCNQNIRLYLGNDPELQGMLAYNEFRVRHIIMRSPPPDIPGEVGEGTTDQFVTGLVCSLECKGLMVQSDKVWRIVDLVARQKPFHPVRDYLNGLPEWDGVKRLDMWLMNYMGVELSKYAMAVGSKFLISAVARVMDPGCKVDYMLVLEGAQGRGKSSAARALATESWFTDQLSDLGSKDCSMQLQGKWIVEMPELDAITRVSDQTRVKAFLSQQEDYFRPPYGRAPIEVQRQCVFLGTCNKAEWIKDETGGRRFWPVECHPVEGKGDMGDIEGLRRDRDLLWAEALHRYRAGEQWWLTDKEVVAEAIKQQADRFQSHPWREMIERWLEQGAWESGVSTTDVLMGCIQKPKDRWEHKDATAVGGCLVSLGWKKRRPRGGDGNRERRYYPE